MYDTKQVSVSGAVGVQVYTPSEQKIIKYLILDAPVSAAVAVLRDGETSGDIKATISTPVGDLNTFPLCGRRFDNGVHVKVTGVGAKAYLVIM